MSRFKIGIAGVGMVGGALNRYFLSKNKKTYVYDKHNHLGSVKELNQADVIFVCVPTPFSPDRGFDLRVVDEACGLISGQKIIVFKSTIWPGTTDKLQKKYPRHQILFNPEFLSEKTADEDMCHPDVQIIGYTATSRGVAKKLLNILPRAPFAKLIPAQEAELFKYFHNVHGAVKIIFANQMYDLCRALGADYNGIKECAAASRHILTDEYLRVNQGNYRGYGGSCFPKDIRALIQFGDKVGVNLELFKTVEKINNGLMRQQRIKNPEKLGRKKILKKKPKRQK